VDYYGENDVCLRPVEECKSFGELPFRPVCRFFPIEAAMAFHGRDRHRRYRHGQDGPLLELPVVELALVHVHLA
jgi:hypothetical protein